MCKGNAHVYKESYLSHQEEMEYYHFVENHLQQSAVVHQSNSPSFHCGISSRLPYKMELKGLLDGCSHYYFCLYRYYGNKHTKNKLRIITADKGVPSLHEDVRKLHTPGGKALRLWKTVWQFLKKFQSFKTKTKTCYHIVQ